MGGCALAKIVTGQGEILTLMCLLLLLLLLLLSLLGKIPTLVYIDCFVFPVIGDHRGKNICRCVLNSASFGGIAKPRLLPIPSVGIVGFFKASTAAPGRNRP